MKWHNILIVEDEAPQAEMHAEFIKQTPYCKQVWLAGNLQQARSMMKLFEPDLILLDNNLPDGTGLEFLHELILQSFTGGIISITSASDMSTVASAMRYGVFDYLIKPIAYERLEKSLQRFNERHLMLQDNNTVSQRRVDEIYNSYARCSERKSTLPIGIDKITLDKIEVLFNQPETEYTAESIAHLLGFSRTTARRYLEFCVDNQSLRAEIIYGKVGRPQRVYHAKKNSLIIESL